MPRLRILLLNLLARYPFLIGIGLPSPRRALLGVGLLAVPLMLGGGAWWGLTLRDAALDARRDLASARRALSPPPIQGGVVDAAAMREGVGRFETACTSADAARVSLERVHGQLGLLAPVVGALDLLPSELAGKARSQTAALEVGRELASVGSALCNDLRPLAALFGQPGAGVGGKLAEALPALVASRRTLVETAERLERLDGTLAEISATDVEGIDPQELAQLRARAPALARTLRETAALLGLLGADGPRRFLVVSQNPDELRATGGYIGSAGVMEVRDGRVALLEYGSSRAYDTPRDRRAPVPPVLQPFLGAGYWHLAGANWSPSFPDAARQLEYFFGLARPEQPVDGVIAVDQYALAVLLEVLGPVDVPEYGERVGAGDVQAAIDRHVHTSEMDEARRKHFTGALTQAVLRRVLEAPSDDLPKLAQAFRVALERQHVIVTVDDAEVSRLLARKRWDGRLLDAPGDYLMLVDSEITASKHSQQVRRDASYRVDLSGPAPRVLLEVTYQNQTDPATRPGVRVVERYRTFLRAYVPPGARLIETRGFEGKPVAYEECGRTVLGGTVTIPMGKTVGVALAYELPERLIGGDAYDLTVQHQPGVPPGRFAFRVLGGSGAAVETDVARGQHLRWRVPPGAAAIEPAPLPESAVECGTPVVTAAPIAAPGRLEIPSLGVSAPVTPLSVDKNGVMETPSGPDVVGWYQTSARAGQPGNSVMSGHVDWQQRTAVFWDLRELRPGDEIRVHGKDGRVHVYAVEWNRVFSASDPPKKEILGGTVEASLTLITCEGDFDPAARDYSHRRVVRATLTESPPALDPDRAG